MEATAHSAIYTASTWIIPLLFAITLHEAAHGYAARRFGDNTAWAQGRVTLNPFKHVDPVGTVLLPGILLLLRSPFLFGYAKPVPVDFGALRNPRRDMVWVALAGPGVNIVLAIVSALLIHASMLAPEPVGAWMTENLANSIVINAVLAVFNMLPLPPLDGGRVVTGLLPPRLGWQFAKIEPFGLLILLGFIFILPMAGQSLGVNLDFFSAGLMYGAGLVVNAILSLTGVQ
jgi:Zn-dependent protease